MEELNIVLELQLFADLLVGTIFSALPTAVAPSTSPASGDWIALISGYIKDGSLVLDWRWPP